MDKILIAASTHWDREWYRTFQEFQIRLCGLMNRLITLLEQDEEFLCYTFDGQSVVLEDYLEIYPENRGRIEKLAAEGRLVFGPLYNLPDEFLSGGEALIRNFLLGDEVCRSVGGRLNAGYVPDNFGHLSQLPQILNGVGIDTAFFFRGVDRTEYKEKEFWWESPDGSRVLCEYMILGYWSLKSWGKMGKTAAEHFYDAYRTLKESSRLNTFLLINGSDHLYQDPDFTAMVRDVKETFPELDIRNGSIADYAEMAKEAAGDCRGLRTVRGELRDFRYGPDPTAVTSCRGRIKRLLFAVQSQVERYAEPLAVLASACGDGFDYPGGLFGKIWRNISISLGHDGISGCSTDEVMDDIKSYLTHAFQSSSRISEAAMEELTGREEYGQASGDESYLAVFNPHPFAYTGMTEQTVHLEKAGGWKDFVLYGDNGEEIPYEILELSDEVITREYLYNSKEKVPRTCVKILFPVKDIPALSIRYFRIQKSRLLEKRCQEFYVRRQPSGAKIENQRFSVTVNEDASINVQDKKNGKIYRGLNSFVDRGEAGDEYQHVSPLLDEHVLARLTGVSVIHNSPLSQKLKITAELNIPDRADRGFLKRSAEYRVCRIVTLVCLTEGTDRVEFTVQIDNPCPDHILFARFPVTLKNPAEYSNTGFEETERTGERKDFAPELKSTQSLLNPMRGYAGLRGKRESSSQGTAAECDGSFHVMGKGLYEYHTKKNGETVDFYITLLRSTSYLFHGLPASWLDGQESTTPVVETKGAMELGETTVEYAVLFDEENPAREAEKYLYPLYGTDIPHLPADRGAGGSFLSFDNENILLSALKKHRTMDGTVVRFYNRSSHEEELVIRTGREIGECRACSLLEELEGEVKHTADTITCTVPGNKIITLYIACR